jgi:Arc/MetJ-type ribon-helix-helix transcriptional regulator
MKTITVATKLTEKMVKVIDDLVKEGYYANRSDALRDAARVLLSIQNRMFSGRAKMISKDDIIREYAKEKGFKL